MQPTKIYIINWTKGFFSRTSLADSGGGLMLSYLLIPFITLGVCLGLYYFLNRMAPQYACFAGWRTNENSNYKKQQMNIGNITISVIIPVYNASVTLPHCLESLHKQTYRNLELLFVDDCSTDESLYILTSYAEQFAEIDFTIRILQHERNRGVAAARNTALKCATGDYIYYVDADDSIEPHTLGMSGQ